MSKRTNPRASRLLNGLTLISRRSLLPAALLCLALILPSNAQAKCAQWDLGRLPPNLLWGILQSNGYIVGFNIKQHGNVLSGSADHRSLEDTTRTGGTLTGEVVGNVVRIRVKWHNGNVGDYIGHINEDGSFGGNTVDKKSGATGTWKVHESQKATCVAEAPSPKPEPSYWSGKSLVGVGLDTERPGNDFKTLDPPTADAVHCQAACSSDSRCKAWTYVKPNVRGTGAAGRCYLKDPAPGTRADACCVSGLRGKALGKPKTSTPAPPPGTPPMRVAMDVDTYDAPGGNGKKLGVLRKDSAVSLLSPCQDNWCNVAGNAVPTGKGWVYSGPDYPSLVP